MHLAAQEGRDSVIEALLSIHNGCVDLRAHDGKTSFRLACIEGEIYLYSSANNLTKNCNSAARSRRLHQDTVEIRLRCQPKRCRFTNDIIHSRFRKQSENCEIFVRPF